MFPLLKLLLQKHCRYVDTLQIHVDTLHAFNWRIENVNIYVDFQFAGKSITKSSFRSVIL